MPETTKFEGFSPAPKQWARIEEITVADWCPTPDGTGPATAVALVITVAGLESPLQMRMKTGPAVDAIIDALTEHRESVFGKR